MIELSADTREAMRSLDAVLGSLRDPSPALNAIGQEFASKTLLGFRDSRSPWGEAWAPLQPSTLRQRRKKGKGAKPLLDTTQLEGSHTYKVSGDTVEIGGNVEYASYQQFGTKRGIPARPFLPIRYPDRVDLPADWEADALALIDDMIEAATDGR